MSEYNLLIRYCLLTTPQVVRPHILYVQISKSNLTHPSLIWPLPIGTVFVWHDDAASCERAFIIIFLSRQYRPNFHLLLCSLLKNDSVFLFLTVSLNAICFRDLGIYFHAVLCVLLIIFIINRLCKIIRE